MKKTTLHLVSKDMDNKVLCGSPNPLSKARNPSFEIDNEPLVWCLECLSIHDQGLEAKAHTAFNLTQE